MAKQGTRAGNGVGGGGDGSRLGRPAARKRNPYSDMEDLDAISIGPTDTLKGAYSFNSVAGRMNEDDEDDDATARGQRMRNLRLDTVKKSDMHAAGLSGIDSGATSFVKLPKLFRTRNKGLGRSGRDAKDGKLAAPMPPSSGYKFQKAGGSDYEPTATWNAIDPTTGSVTSYSTGTTTRLSSNPMSISNTPVGVTFGFRSLPSKSYSGSVVSEGPCGFGSQDGSSVYLSALSGSGSEIVEESMFVSEADDNDPVGRVHDRGARLHSDVVDNFVNTAAEMYSAAAPLTAFQKRNSEWISADMSSPAISSFSSNIGDGNVVVFKRKTDDRVKQLDLNGLYLGGKNLGEVSKRLRFGFVDMVEELEREIMSANTVFMYWAGLPAAERMELLDRIRRPIVLFEGKAVAADGDLLCVPLPLVYEARANRRRLLEDQRNRMERRSGLATHESSTSMIRSDPSHVTRDPRGTVGCLGDCDDDYTFDRQMMQTGSFSGTDRASVMSSVAMRLSSVQCGESAASVASWQKSVGNSSVFARASRPKPSTRSEPSISSKQHSTSVAVSRASTVTNIATSGFIIPASDALDGADHNGYSGSRLRELVNHDDSLLLQSPREYGGDGLTVPGNIKKFFDFYVRNEGRRGRLVVVKLDRLVKFTPGAFARRVFGGLVQEFQLHPSRSAALVLFMYAPEARSFIQHVQNVRQKGTAQEKTALQFDAWWYRGKESESVVEAQRNVAAHQLVRNATRAIRLYGIDIKRTYAEISDSLGSGLGMMILHLIISKPEMRHKESTDGYTIVVELSSLVDSITAFDLFKRGAVAGFENLEIEFTRELTARPTDPKDYCGCMNCCEARSRLARRKQARNDFLQSQYDRASSRRSAAMSGQRTNSGSYVNSQGLAAKTSEMSSGGRNVAGIGSESEGFDDVEDWSFAGGSGGDRL